MKKLTRLTKDYINNSKFATEISEDGTVTTTSFAVAHFLGKPHDNIVQDIEEISNPKFGFGKEFAEANFIRTACNDASGQKVPYYKLTRNGFAILFRLYKGFRAKRVRKMLIKSFNIAEELATAFPDMHLWKHLWETHRAAWFRSAQKEKL